MEGMKAEYIQLHPEIKTLTSFKKDYTGIFHQKITLKRSTLNIASHWLYAMYGLYVNKNIFLKKEILWDSKW